MTALNYLNGKALTLEGLKEDAIELLKQAKEQINTKIELEYLDHFYGEDKINSLENEEDLEGLIQDLDSDRGYYTRMRNREEYYNRCALDDSYDYNTNTYCKI